MNIKQALKRKNKLVGEINEEFNKVSRYNVVDEGNPRPYSSSESLKKWFDLTNELVELKTKIHLANGPVYDKIFLLAELKSQVNRLKSLDCTSGKVTSRWSEDGTVTKHAEINVVERDNMVKQIESTIESIQEELDQWNHTTNI
jgi:hypothetical protein